MSTDTDTIEKDYSAKSEFPPVTEGEDNVITEHRDAHLAAVELYSGVAEHLPGWSFQQEIRDRHWFGPTVHYKLTRDAYPGHAITLETGRSSRAPRGKVHVSGFWPSKDPANYAGFTSPYDVREDSPSINVSMDRGHQVIAKQILGRFLPEYLRIYDKILAKLAEDNAYQDRRAANWKRLTDAKLVIDARRGHDGQQYIGDVRIGTRTANGWDYDKGYGTVTMSGEDSVTLELRSLPIDTAMRVLKAIQGDSKEVK